MNLFSVVILTYNDDKQIGRLLDDLKDIEKVIVVDSYSTDNTQEIVESYGRKFIQNTFRNQASQINWAIGEEFLKDDWVLRLDSDERVTSCLLFEIEQNINQAADTFVGYIEREMYWMGKKLRFSAQRRHFIGRIWQIGQAYYEDVTEEHLIHKSKSIYFKTKFYEENMNNDIIFFIKKHIITGLGEVSEITKENLIEDNGSLFSNHKHRVRRWIKVHAYNKLPLYIRPTFYFLYRYILKLGFLDGKAGFSFCFFQAFFYRMLIDQLVYENKKKKE
ncbi:glycosyltransferase family 2 protein [Amylibacter sp.]|jgi:glycosyltransferase involved in cell wall biosynthesis|nr:glycosyltransferase family 2 protein [Amylibacter sp.]